ncbi:MAG: peptide ABC transporter substrate-binding protein [Chloroflexi bacterium]|nr:peptide ABC transporter substrate-binding protein [Chloroflexota bacterium]
MHKSLFLGAAAAVMAAAVACGGSESSADPVVSASPTPVPTRASAPQIAPGLQDSTPLSGDNGGPRAGGRFTLVYSDPPTLDPHLVVDGTSFGVVVELFSGLVSLDKSLRIVPELAESWEVLEGGTVYKFRLRPGIKFSNGDPVTAQDFKWSLERAGRPETASAVAETYLGDIVGMQDLIDGDAGEASGIQVIDERNLRITIDAPKAYFLAKMTYPTAYVLNRKNVESGGNGWTDSPVGTGAFTLSEYRVGQRIRLARNENYWGRQAYLDEVFFNLSGGVSMAMYENDEIDITGVGLADLDRVNDPSEPLNRDLVDTPAQFGVQYIGFNVDKPPFDDPKFRQALNLAVDKELISSQVFADLFEPAFGIIPPDFPGFDPDLVGLRYDLDRAKQLLSESRYADAASRPRIVVTVPGSGGSPGLDVEVIADLWRQELGVNVEIQQVEWATYLQDLNRKRLQAWGGVAWQADYPDPQDFIDILFYSDTQGNRGNYSNARVDELIVQARTEQDIQERIKLYREAEQIIVEEAAWLPLWFDTERKALLKQRVQDYTFSQIAIPKFKDVWVTDAG